MLSRPNMVMNHGRPAAGRACPGRIGRLETQGGQVDQAATVGGLQRVGVALEAGCSRQPGLEIAGHRAPALCDRPASSSAVRRSRPRPVTRSRAARVVHRPCGFEADLESNAVLVDRRRRRWSRYDVSRSKVSRSVAQNQALLLDDCW